MTLTEPPVELSPQLADVIRGLVPFQLIRLAPMSPRERALLAHEIADELGEAGDRITNPAPFKNRKDRSRVLTTLALGIAIGAMHHGGITWCGLHWCTAPHPDCPKAAR